MPAHRTDPASDEQRRLAALRSYDILDTSPEEEYDDIVALAAQICGVPLASITLVDETRQWFKARHGLDASETPRSLSFCAHAIQRPDELLVIPDARLDPRFRELVNVTGEPRIRFYAGAPLVTHEGWALGTLCVFDRKPRGLPEDQARALRVLRRHVVNALELRRLIKTQSTAIDELRRAQAELERARLAAEDGARAKSQFLAAMSHEIRTPMNAVVGMTTLLRATRLDPAQKECVDTIRTSGELLLTIINDILDFSKIESGRMALETLPFEVARCAADAADLLAASAQAKGLELRVRIDPAVPAWIRGDVTRVRQILVNLLSNAVKFTDRGSVTVSIRPGDAAPAPGSPVELVFSVADTGIGIPADRIGRLCEQFTQADGTIARRYGGTGLGLAISKRLAGMHGGRLWIESTPGVGSTFSFSIHAEPASPPPAAATPASGAPFDSAFARSHPLSLLVAEDNPVNQKVARLLLEKLGYAPELVANGLEALVALRRHPFDVVLMDIEMPEMDGLSAARALRAELPAGRQPAVIAVTAHALDSGRAHGDDGDMDHCLVKPIRLPDLTAALARAAAWRDARRSR